MKKLMRLWKDDEGATAVEYGIMVALIAVAIIIAVTAVGTNLTTLFNRVAAAPLRPTRGGALPRRPARRGYSAAATLLNSVVRFVPTAVTAMMIATAISATMIPYSTAVAPSSSFHSLISFVMGSPRFVCILRLCEHRGPPIGPTDRKATVRTHLGPAPRPWYGAADPV